MDGPEDVPRNEAGPGHETGLAALGVCGQWSVQVDEALRGPDAWFLQIESPLLHLYCRLAGLEALAEAVARLTGLCSGSGAESGVASSASGEYNAVRIGTFEGTPVELLKDDESDERWEIILAGPPGAHLRVVLHRRDMAELLGALRDALADLGAWHDNTTS